MRDYQATLRPASYRGVRFYVENEGQAGGRRLQVHEFPGRDAPVVEDLGRKAGRFTVRAYVASDDFEGEIEALFSACNQMGPGALVLPALGALTVHCLDISTTAERGRRGYASFDLAFVEEGAGSAPYALGLGGRLAVGLADGIAGIVGPALDAVMGIVGPALDVAGWVEEASRLTMIDALAGIDVARLAAGLPADLSASVSAALGDAVDGLGSVAGMVGFGATAAGAIRLFAGDEASDLTLSALEALAEPAAATVLPARATRSRQTEARQADAIRAAVSVAAYAEACAGAAARTYASRREAVAWRTRYAELGGRVVEAVAAALDEDSYAAANQVRGTLAQHLSRTVATLAPIVRVTANESLPATVWAWQLYRDPARAAELAAFNDVPHAAFMPTVFEAPSR